MKPAEPDVGTRIKPEKKETLLSKYDIQIENISYEYIGKSKNAKELERMVRILRSGEEGCYPHLLQFTEERLAELKPGSTVLRTTKPVLSRQDMAMEEIREFEGDISSWMQEMRMLERDLEEEKTMTATQSSLPKPSVRKDYVSATEKPRQMRNKEERLKSGDYEGWDKYDADTELNKIDLVTEVETAEAKRQQERHKIEIARSRKDTIIEKSLLTGTELSLLSSREREKGNEAFRAGDYEEALQLYTTSIAMDEDVNAYNNRAMTHIKMKNYDKAIKDCNTVLKADCSNLKGLLRRALAYQHLEKNTQALIDYEQVLKIEPENKTALAFVNKMREIDESKPVRLTIEEIYD